jgi:hypothetical protein
MLAAREDTYGPDYLVQAVEGPGQSRTTGPRTTGPRTTGPWTAGPWTAGPWTTGPWAVKSEAADGHIRPAPDNPGVRFRVEGRYPDCRGRRRDRPGAGDRCCDLRRPGGLSPRAAHLTTHPALT